jgi:hypothetical protein
MIQGFDFTGFAILRSYKLFCCIWFYLCINYSITSAFFFVLPLFAEEEPTDRRGGEEQFDSPKNMAASCACDTAARLSGPENGSSLNRLADLSGQLRASVLSR